MDYGRARLFVMALLVMLAAMVVGYTSKAYGAPGDLDTSFGTGGKVTTPIGDGSSDDYGLAVAIGADGKIVVAGHTFNGANDDIAVARYKPDGTLDATFSGDGIVVTTLGSGDDKAFGVALQGTRIVVAGYAFNGTNAYDFALVRYDANGNPDSTFGVGGADGDGKVMTDFCSGCFDHGYGLAVQEDGKIVVAGESYNPYDPSVNIALARYDANGNPDTTLSGDGKTTTDFAAYAFASDVALQEDGKIVVAGQSYNANDPSSNDFAVARYSPNGYLDGEFDFDGRATTDFGGADDSASSVAVQDDGRIVAAGSSGTDFALARYNTDGSPNNAFSNDGRVKTDFGGGSADHASGVALQTDGRIVAAGGTYTGSTTGNDFALARYFGGSGDVTPPKVSRPAHALQSATTLGASTTSASVPTKISWSATDAEGEVTRYQLQRSTDGGAYANVALGEPASTTVALSQLLTPDHNYRYRVRAQDDNGNTSFYKYGPRFTVDAHQETSSAIAYSGTWTQQALSGSYGGAVKYATASGATAKLTFTGTTVAWVAPKSSTRGQAEVYLDGRKVATVDLYSSTALSRRVVYAANGLDPSVSHRLQIKVLGTKNASSSGTRVDVDAFVVLR